MTCKLCRLVCVGVALIFAAGAVPQPVSADNFPNTPNTLMAIDGMTLTAAGLFRDPGSFPYHNLPLDNNGAPIADGFNTFQFGGFNISPPITKGYGQYDAFRWQQTSAADCCISHNARYHTDTPDNVVNPSASPQTTTRVGEFDPALAATPYPPDSVSVTKDYLPIIDRNFFGQVFDPSQYSMVVKFKPLLTKATADSLGTNPYPTNPTYPNITPASGLENTAPFFTVGVDQLGGEVWDAQAGAYKRGDQQVFYNIGSAATPINNWYATAPHDADGFATFSVPVTTPTNIARGFYYNFGNGGTRTNDVAANGGIDAAGTDVIQAYDATFHSFGGGPADPSNPSNKLNTPNGVPLLFFGAPNTNGGPGNPNPSFEIKSIALQRTTQGPVVARMDSASGITFRFGTGFTYQAGRTTAQPGITVNGTTYFPTATDQISRFDANGMTNLIFNEQTPVNPNETDRFILRNGPEGLAQDATAAGNGAKFVDCTNCMFNVRAKLTQLLSTPGVAQHLTIVVKDRQGNDGLGGGAGNSTLGADEWDYDLDLSHFNTSTMTTFSIPLSMFTRNLNSSSIGAAPVGFNNSGDGTLANFGLYEFGGSVPGANVTGGGLLKLEMEYMEIRLPSQVLAGDYNGNGVVDAADYTVWRDKLGQSVTIPGDTTPGTVVQADYDVWKNNFGAHAGSGSGALSVGAVPEPATWLLGLIGFVGAGVLRRRKS
jgi:PEP-CTERM motif